ncbi:nitroreductase family deazaflavin-dependent oxidoreductase [Streptomyces sp. RB6PN25]|uniref:Nitroreductase family deazaflavin-dependent oxidoreductase n=1 Tax=Streptomyces humicola TaxID=2953240 RepID=A0ABT1PTE1_9ACTN|nr:nitroreductase family deazaflavin-dependent oxidoreductase [Streptomyces humicola]MCQ4080946.1 nitroreductase family deazaflavin-dependent oxidoreductase [Streptomyces humicola]
MLRKVKDVPSPTGLRRLLVRAPIRLYHWHLGWLFGQRFVLLTHTGRLTGQQRQVLLEVAGRDCETDAYLVASGFGVNAQWYRNVRQDPAVTIRVGRRRAAAVAALLTPEECGSAMAEYATRHPRAAAQLMRVCGLQVDGSRADFCQAGRDHIRFVRLTPVGAGHSGRPSGEAGMRGSR